MQNTSYCLCFSWVTVNVDRVKNYDVSWNIQRKLMTALVSETVQRGTLSSFIHTQDTKSWKVSHDSIFFLSFFFLLFFFFKSSKFSNMFNWCFLDFRVKHTQWLVRNDYTSQPINNSIFSAKRQMMALLAIFIVMTQYSNIQQENKWEKWVLEKWEILTSWSQGFILPLNICQICCCYCQCKFGLAA